MLLNELSSARVICSGCCVPTPARCACSVSAPFEIAASAIVCATVYLASRTFVERLLTRYQAWGIVMLSAMFAAAWLTLLRAAGMPLNENVRGRRTDG